MIDFVLFLLITAAAQVFGCLISWFFVKKFYHNLKLVMLVEILLMLAVSLLLIEEGLRVTFFVIISVFIGIFAMSLLNKIIPHKHGTETEAERIGVLVFFAMCFHEFPEGLAFGSAYLINPQLGMATALLIALHNLPEGSVVAIPYFIKNKFIGGLKAVSITQFLYALGGLIGYCFLVNVPREFQVLVMTFAAGAMLYIIYEESLWLGAGAKEGALRDKIIFKH